jgi:hypothetical protein
MVDAAFHMWMLKASFHPYDPFVAPDKHYFDVVVGGFVVGPVDVTDLYFHDCWWKTMLLPVVVGMAATADPKLFPRSDRLLARRRTIL